MISNGRQEMNQSDVDAVVAMLKSDFLWPGRQAPLFEN